LGGYRAGGQTAKFLLGHSKVLPYLNNAEAVCAGFGLNREDVMASVSVDSDVDFVYLNL